MAESQLLPVTESMMECKCCFEKINAADQFCQKCGFPLKGSEEEQNQFFYNRNYQHMEINALDKKIKSATTTLYVLAGLSFLIGIIYFSVNPAEDNGSAILITYTVIAIIYLLLGVWAKTKPVASIISGMVLYILIELMGAIENPASIFRGIILKIIIISYLIKGLMSAIEAEKIRKQHNI
ncbi:MAG: hypothetical protein ABIR15_07510 [Chitinophagaceae bacterium]